jgi:hypothetical protein
MKEAKRNFHLFIEIPSPYLAFSGSSRLHLKTKIKRLLKGNEMFLLRVYRKLSETSARREKKNEILLARDKNGVSGGFVYGFFAGFFFLQRWLVMHCFGSFKKKFVNFS